MCNVHHHHQHQWAPNNNNFSHPHPQVPLPHSASVPNLDALDAQEDGDHLLPFVPMTSSDSISLLRMLVSQLRAAQAEQRRLQRALHIAQLEADTYKQAMIKFGLGSGAGVRCMADRNNKQP